MPPVSLFTGEEHTETYTLIVCLVLLAVVTSSVVLFWKNKYEVFVSSADQRISLCVICY